MKGKLSKRVIAVVMLLLMTTGGLPIQELKCVTVLADEMQGEDITISDISESDAVKSLPIEAGKPSQLPSDAYVFEDLFEEEQTAEGENDLDMNDTLVSETVEASVNEAAEEDIVSDEKLVADSANQWTVGDNVTAKLVVEGGENVLYFESQGGTLWKDWKKKIGDSGNSIDAIKFAENSDIMYFPEDSESLFSGYSSYNEHNLIKNVKTIELDKADTSKVVNMSIMFGYLGNLESLDLRNFNTSEVTSMEAMFMYCTNLSYLNVSSFDTSKVKEMSSMFCLCGNLETLDVSGFNTSNVESFGSMFAFCSNLRTLDVSNFDTSNSAWMNSMFEGCENLEELDVSGFDTSSATVLETMFCGCKNLSVLNVEKFNTSNVQYMSGMFSDCTSLQALDVTGFDTSKAQYMTGLFQNCSSLKTLDVTGFDTSEAQYMRGMFAGCSGLLTLDLSGFNTANALMMDSMFSDCSSLKELDISGFDTKNVGKLFGGKNISLFSGCTNLQMLKTPKNNDCTVELPTEMYDESDNEYVKLPILSRSIVLRTIEKTSIANASIAGVSLSYGYSGKAYTPAITITVNGVTLTKDKDYTVKYANNKNPGIAKITITGKGKYTGTRIKNFEIVDCVSSIVSGKTYQLIPKNNSKTAVCSYSGKMVNNTKVYITDRSNSEAMKFKAIKNSDGTWKFINAKCELALAVQQNSSEVGKGLVLYDQTTKKAQNWKLSKKSDNSFAIMNAVTGYSIAMSDASAVKGTTLSMAETASSGLQRFYIAETTAVSTPFDGTYGVKAAKDKKFALNIASSSKSDGANVNLYSYSNVNAKKFKVMYSGGGYYRLVNVNSGLVLTVKGNAKTDGANVVQSSWSAADGQRWKITKNSDGTVTMKNVLGTVLHLSGNKTANGTNVMAKTAASTKAQRWYLE